jgi:ferritin-like metal-binding protein YciE
MDAVGECLLYHQTALLLFIKGQDRMMETKTLSLKELYIDHLRDLHDAEHQIVRALPKIIKRITAPGVRKGLEVHLKETFKHIERLDQIFEKLGRNPRGKRCAGMEGILQEGHEIMAEKMEMHELMDAALIGASQKVEHYEISAYETVIALAEWLGESAALRLLRKTLEEEKAAEVKLTQLRTSEVMKGPETFDTPLVKRNSLKKQLTINDSPGG